MKKTTLQDIATELGISKGTVYRAIHDKMDVSPSTRTKVLELVEKWNYKPDRIARSLSTKNSAYRNNISNNTGFFLEPGEKRYNGCQSGV